jgi:hypothetical protein
MAKGDTGSGRPKAGEITPIEGAAPQILANCGMAHSVMSPAMCTKLAASVAPPAPAVHKSPVLAAPTAPEPRGHA